MCDTRTRPLGPVEAVFSVLLDSESGYTFKVRETREYTYANVQGHFGGVPAVDGSVGTYTVRAMERVS